MKKSFKKLLSLALAVLMIVSCIFTTALTASADSYLAEPYYAFDFEDGKTSFTGTYYSATREVITQEDGNNVLSITAGGNAYTTFPAKFVVGKEYTVSFKYKLEACDFGTNAEPKFAVGLKASKRNGSTNTQIKAMSWISVTEPDTTFRTYSHTFTFTAEMLNSENEYLLIAFEKSSNTGTFQYLVDNIVVKETGGTVAFNTNGGSTVASVKGYPGQILDIEAPTKDECVFTGWYSDADCTQKVDSIIVPEKDVTTTLYAGWEVINHYYFDFEDGKTAFTGTYYTAERKVVAENGNNVLSVTTQTGSNAYTIFPARFEVGKEYVLSFKYKIATANLGTSTTPKFVYSVRVSQRKSSAPSSTVISGDSWVSVTAADTAYRTFTKTFTFTEAMQSDVNNYLTLCFGASSGTSYEFYIDDISVRETGGTVAFDTNGGTAISSVTGYPGKVVDLPTPTKNECTFAGWYLDEALTQKAENVVIPAKGTTTTLYADWDVINHYYFDFEDDKTAYTGTWGAATRKVITETDGNKAFLITTTAGGSANTIFPVRFEVGKEYVVSFKYKVASCDLGTSTTPKFVYGVKLAQRGGSNPGGVISGDSWVSISQADASYRTFNKTITFTQAMQNGNNEYLALFFGASSGTSYEFYVDDISVRETGGTVVYNTNGGTAISSVTGYPGQVIELPTPKYNGYKFLGWYTDAEFTNAVESVVIPAKNETVNVYAKWELITNVDFEDGKDSIIGIYGNYGDLNTYGNFTKDVVQDGDTKALNINVIGKSVVTLPIKLDAGKTYKYSFDYKLTDYAKKDETKAYQVLMELDAAEASGYPGWPTNQIALPWNWKSFSGVMSSYATQSGTFTVGEKGGFFALYFQLGANIATLGMNLDNIKVIEMTTPETPAAPTIKSVENNVVTLNTVDGCEYRLNGGDWQSSPVFKGIVNGAELNFTQRVKATTYTFASEESAALTYTIALPGDTNTDNVYDGEDMISVTKVLLNVVDGNTDFNADGKVNVQDLVYIKNHIANITDATVMSVGEQDINGFKVYSDSAAIAVQARDEFVEAVNTRGEGLVSTIDEIGENEKVITLLIDEKMSEDSYILKVENSTIIIKAGSDYALLDAVRFFATVLNNYSEESIIRLVNGYTIEGNYVGLAYTGAAQKKNL